MMKSCGKFNFRIVELKMEFLPAVSYFVSKDVKELNSVTLA